MAHQAVIERLSQRGVRQIAITWVTNAGESLVKVVPLRQLQDAIDNGVGFSPVSDAFRTDGVIEPHHRLTCPDGDLRLKVDPDSVALLDPSTGWAWAAGDRWDRDQGPYDADQRHFCRRMARDMEDEGLTRPPVLNWSGLFLHLTRGDFPSRSSPVDLTEAIA